VSPVRKWLVAAAIVVASVGLSTSAQASLIGQTLTHEVPQSAPPFSQSFLVTQGLGPELTPFGQWTLDVEADTVVIEFLVSGPFVSPLDFILSGISGGISAVTVDPSSTFLPTALNLTATSIDINLDNVSVTEHQFLVLHVTQSESVPEPTSLALLGLGLVMLGLSRRKPAA